MCACVRACVCACVRACVCMFVCVLGLAPETLCAVATAVHCFCSRAAAPCPDPLFPLSWHALPCHLMYPRRMNKHIRMVTTETVARLLTGQRPRELKNFFIIDCRYPFEFEGGHITGLLLTLPFGGGGGGEKVRVCACVSVSWGKGGEQFGRRWCY